MYRGTISYQQTFQQKFASQKGVAWYISSDEKKKMSYDQEYSTGQAVFEGES